MKGHKRNMVTIAEVEGSTQCPPAFNTRHRVRGCTKINSQSLTLKNTSSVKKSQSTTEESPKSENSFTDHEYMEFLLKNTEVSPNSENYCFSKLHDVPANITGETEKCSKVCQPPNNSQAPPSRLIPAKIEISGYVTPEEAELKLIRTIHISNQTQRSKESNPAAPVHCLVNLESPNSTIIPSMTIDVEQTPLEDTINASNFAKQSEGSKEFSLDNTLQYTSNLKQSGSAPADSINIAAEQTSLEEAAVTSFLAKEKPQGNSSYDSPMKDSVNQTRSVSLTKVAAMCNDDDSSMDEVGSHSSLVTVGGYKIKQASVPLLEAIFQKHGDIAANCTLVSTQGRSRFLEDVCEIVKTLQDSNFLKITQEEIQGKFDYVCDLLNLDIQVWWLQNRLADILEAKELVKQSSTLKREKDKQMEMISEKERELKLYEEKISMIKEEQ